MFRPTRTLMLFLVLALALAAFAACGDDDDDGDGETPTTTAEATDPTEPATGDTTPTQGENGGTPTEGEDGEAPTPAPTTGPGVEAPVPADAYVFELTPAMLQDRDQLQAAAEQAANESGLDEALIRTQAGRFVDRPFDRARMIFLDPSDELGLPLIDIRACMAAGENPGNVDLLRQGLEEQDATVESAGTVEHGGTSYELLRYTTELLPGLVQFRTHVEVDGCWAELTMTALEENGDEFVDALRQVGAELAIAE